MFRQDQMVRIAPADGDFVIMLFGRVEAAESRKAGSSDPLLVGQIGLTAESAREFAARVRGALARYREEISAFRREQRATLRARPTAKPELGNFLRALQARRDAAQAKLIDDVLVELSPEEQARLRQRVARQDQASISKQRVDVAAIEQDPATNAAAVVESMCAGRPKVTRESFGIDIFWI